MADLDRVNKSYQARTHLLEVTLTHADLVDAVSGEAETVNIGGVLPAGAYLIGADVEVTTLFSGGSISAMKMSVGFTNYPGAIATNHDVFTGAATGHMVPTGAAAPNAPVGGKQLFATFNPTGDSNSNATAGSVTLHLMYGVAENDGMG